MCIIIFIRLLLVSIAIESSRVRRWLRCFAGNSYFPNFGIPYFSKTTFLNFFYWQDILCLSLSSPPLNPPNTLTHARTVTVETTNPTSSGSHPHSCRGHTAGLEVVMAEEGLAVVMEGTVLWRSGEHVTPLKICTLPWLHVTPLKQFKRKGGGVQLGKNAMASCMAAREGATWPRQPAAASWITGLCRSTTCRLYPQKHTCRPARKDGLKVVVSTSTSTCWGPHLHIAC